MTLSEYRKKRDFERTPEPAGKKRAKKARDGIFVVQKHRARRLHYDLRLELSGALVSWAVPKGPSLDPGAKRLAVRVEDHPLDYADFEGVIPGKEYGAGEVIVWDKGTWKWTPTPGRAHARNAAEALGAGKLDFTVSAKKLEGRFVLVRLGKEPGEKNWLLKKVRDEDAKPGSDVTSERPESVLTGRKIEDLRSSAG
ncbi:hypothetical protein HY251_14715 [bacterium]|nr:hypothetical protein [bacterium]